MASQLVPGSNTLAHLLAMAAGHMLDVKLMPLGGDEYAITIIPTPTGTTKPLPPLRGTIKAGEAIDQVVSQDVAMLFIGELAADVDRATEYRRQLEKDKSAPHTGKIEKPGDKMPPPTGKKEGASKAKPAPAGPPTPAATAPAPAAEGLFAQAAPNVADVVASVAPANELVEDAQVVVDTDTGDEYDF